MSVQIPFVEDIKVISALKHKLRVATPYTRRTTTT